MEKGGQRGLEETRSRRSRWDMADVRLGDMGSRTRKMQIEDPEVLEVSRLARGHMTGKELC